MGTKLQVYYEQDFDETVYADNCGCFCFISFEISK